MKAELFRGMSYDDYVKIDALRQSTAKEFKRSALHGRDAMLRPGADTKSTFVGTALHTCVFEPKKFLSDYAVAPKIDKRTNIGKAEWARFQAEHPGALCLEEPEYQRVMGMARAVYAHPFVESILPLKSLREFVVTWDETVGSGDEELVVRCKARLDWAVEFGDSLVVDLKSTGDAQPNEFARSINKWGYQIQAASNLRGLQAFAPIDRPRRYLWIAVENEEPFGVAVYEASEGLLAQGDAEFRRCVRLFGESKKANSWPGYPTNIMPIDMPRWAWTNEEAMS